MSQASFTMRSLVYFLCKLKEFHDRTLPKQQRILTHFLLFPFPKCVNGKILSFLKFFIIKKNANKNLDFNNLKIKQTK